MDYQIASKNVIFTIVLLSQIYIIGVFLYKNVSNNQTVTLCSNGQQLTAVFHLREEVTVLIPASSVKDTLDCLRRGMSFNDRTIEYVIAKDTSSALIEVLHARYAVNEEQDELELALTIPVRLSGDTVEIGGASSIAVFLKEISNPFKFIEYVAEKNSPTVIVPEINEVIARLIEKNIIDSNIIITELREGEYATIDL